MEGLEMFDPFARSCGSLQDEKPTEIHISEVPCKLCGKDQASPRKLQRSTSGEVPDLVYMKQEMDDLRRENNSMVLEVAYLKKENSLYMKRLTQEQVIRERLKNELKGFHAINMQNKENVSIDYDVFQEQLKVYRDDYHEEKKERERYSARNFELQHELEEAKQLLEKQQKKLLFYAQIISQPFRTELDLPLLKPNRSKIPNDVPPCTRNVTTDAKKHTRYSSKSNHIIEATLRSGERPRIKRASPSDYNENERKSDVNCRCKTVTNNIQANGHVPGKETKKD